MGTKFICKKLPGGIEIPEDAVATWKDTSDGHYGLLKATSVKVEETAEGLIHQGGMSSAVWEIGSAIYRVKTWTEGMEMESDTIAFVATRFPHIPIPEVIYSWVDEELDRTREEKAEVATTIAQYCSELATASSDNLQSATGRGVLEPFFAIEPKQPWPRWKPYPIGPFSRTVAEKYFQKISTQSPPPLGDKFHFYHTDLGPTNILLSNDSNAVQAIIDWESAAFPPKFWIPLKPWRSGGFNLDIAGDARYDWTDLLEPKLSDLGFILDHAHVQWQKTLNDTFFDIDELMTVSDRGLSRSSNGLLSVVTSD